MKLSRSLALLYVLAACGDNLAAPDAHPDSVASDAPGPDAFVCDPTGYPPVVNLMSVQLGAEYPLTLDGTGTRCEQIVRALLGPARPPELAQLDTVGGTGMCFHDDELNREIVHLRGPLYAGAPLFAPIQDVLAHISVDDAVVYLDANFLPAGSAPAPGCLSADAVAAAVAGTPMDYKQYQFCIPNGGGSYVIGSGDVIEVSDEGYYLDTDSKLRRVRAVDVYLAPEHVTDAMINSDAYCCQDGTLDHCVGKRMFFDVFTGELIGTETHCLIC